MSVIGNLRRLSEVDLTRLLESPETIASYLYGDDDGEDGGDNVEGFGPHADLDLDKAWHGVHFLLTGDPTGGNWPWCFLQVGGTSVGDQDVGYGPARGFGSSAVKEIAGALNMLDRGTLVARFNPEEMIRVQIYPDIWDRREEDDQNLEYVLDAFESLRDFLNGAADAGEAVLVYFN